MAIIFDCDGVLVQSERLVCEIEQKILAGYGWQQSTEEIRAQFKGKTFLQIAQIIRGQLGDALPDDWMYHWGLETANGFRKRLKPIPGVEGVIACAVGQQVPIAVASQSALARVELSLGVCRLEQYFTGRVFSAAMVAHPKPAPDLFLLAAKRLAVPPAECTVIEDSPSGVRAAVAAGMRVLGYAADEDPERLRDAGAEVFYDMKDAIGLLDLER